MNELMKNLWVSLRSYDHELSEFLEEINNSGLFFYRTSISHENTSQYGEREIIARISIQLMEAREEDLKELTSLKDDKETKIRELEEYVEDLKSSISGNETRESLAFKTFFFETLLSERSIMDLSVEVYLYPKKS